MSRRFYLCPVIGDGLTPDTAYRSKIQDLSGASGAVIPSNPDGSPQFTWTAAIVQASDWTAIDADPTLEKLFDTADLPDSINTFAEVKTFMQSKTVGDIPPARRQALNLRLTSKGIDTSQVTLQTTWWQVLRGIYRHLNGGVFLANDGPQV